MSTTGVGARGPCNLLSLTTSREEGQREKMKVACLMHFISKMLEGPRKRSVILSGAETLAVA